MLSALNSVLGIKSLNCGHIDIYIGHLELRNRKFFWVDLLNFAITIFSPYFNDMLKCKIRFIFTVPSRAPSYIRLSNFEQTDVKVQWNPLSQYYANGRLLGYRVYFREYRSYYYYSYLTESVNTSSANVTMVILRDLKEATTYQIAVTAFTSKGEGPRSYWMSITTGNAHFFCCCCCCYYYVF